MMRGLEEKTIAGLPVDSFWPVAWGRTGSSTTSDFPKKRTSLRYGFPSFDAQGISSTVGKLWGWITASPPTS